MKTLTQLKSKNIPETRNKILKEQDNRCMLCNNDITENSGASLDHQHMTSKETIGENGAGLVRGVLCRACNVMEGKIWNNSKRFGLHDDLSNWLRTLADYLDKDNYPLIHPSEEPKDPKVSKRNYNKLKKLYNLSGKKAKFPEYPKSSKLTIKLKVLFEEFSTHPYN